MESHRHTPGSPPLRARNRVATLLVALVLGSSAAVAGSVTGIVPAQPALAAGTFSDPFFREITVFSGLTKPTSVRFDADGRAWVTEKSGVIKEFDSVTDTTATVVADYSAEVMNYWDRGLLSLALDPGFTTGSPYLYIFYVWGAEPGDTSQDWGDACPAPPGGPGATTDGCVGSTKVDRLTIDLATRTVTQRDTLLWDACQQFPSHSGGGMAFGADGQLYISFGDGASFTGLDYGQRGGTVPDATNPITPLNPCADPVTRTSPSGSAPTVDVPTAEGGMLRAQDVRTTGDPTSLDGTVIRIDPATGAASAGNPLIASGDLNTRRIVANGFRNPFRMTFRPGTGDLYVGHVGNNTWEAIDRVPAPSSGTVTTLPNAGWPCYEGPAAYTAFQSLGTNMCASLYGQGSAAWLQPFYAYSHLSTLSPSGPCFAPVNGRDGGSPTGLAFYEGSTGSTVDYPAKYLGGLFFVDYDRDCLAFFPKGAGGVPDASKMEQIAVGIGNPVDLVTGPDGDLYYVDHDNGRIVRLRYLLAPVAVATATPTSAAAPADFTLDATGSSDPDPEATLTAYRWDLDNDGQFNDATGPTYVWHVATPAVYQVGLQVESSNGLTDTTTITVNATNDPPTPVIDGPSSLLTWAVDDTISFSGHATDPQDGSLPASALSWDVVMLHCPADCHEHVVQTFSGVASGSFQAPDHEYPSHLELRLTATDTDGLVATTSVALNPRTRTVGVTSTPSGINLTVAGATLRTPATATVIEHAGVEVSAPVAATVGGARYRFSRWADGTDRIRTAVADSNLSFAATFVPDAGDTCSTARSSVVGSWTADRASGYGDVDWFRFTLSSSRRVVVSLGDLPVDARLDLYGSCSARLATTDHAGLRYEELTKSLRAGTYRVKVSFHNDARSDSPYVVRFRALASGTVVKSATTVRGAGGGSVRIVGEVINNTSATTGRATVTATFRSGSGAVVGTLKALGFSSRLAVGGVSSFVLQGTVPAYASVRYGVTTGSPGASRSLSLVSLTLTANTGGTVTERGTVRNTGSTTARSVGVARTWYGDRGEVLERGAVTVSPSTLAPGRSATFTIVRPAIPGIQANRSQLRAT